MTRHLYGRAWTVAALWVAAVACLADASAAPSKALKVTFITGKPLPRPSPYLRSVALAFRHEALVVAGGRLIDVTKWRPAGKGAGLVVTIRAGAKRLGIRLARGPGVKLGADQPDSVSCESVDAAGLVAKAREAARSMFAPLGRKGAGGAPSPIEPIPPAALVAFEKALAVRGDGAAAGGGADAMLRKRSLLARAVNSAPGWALAHLELGKTASAQGDAKRAVESLLKAHRLNPLDPEAQAELALAYRRIGRAAEAISHYSAALALAPSDPVIHNNFGVALLAAQQAKGAVAHFTMACRIEPLYHEPRVNLGSWYRATGEEKKADQHYRRAIEAAPNAPGPRIALARLLTDAGKHRAAEKELEAAVAANPEHAPVRLEFALALARRQRHSPAIENLEYVLKIAPEYKEAWYNLGICYHHAGRHDKAVEVFEKAIRREPDYAHLYYGLGLAYEGKDENTLAEEALKMALEKDPTLQAARLALRRVRGGRAAPQLAWPWGLWCGSGRDEGSGGTGSDASCIPAAITLTALFLPALVRRR